MAEGMKQVPKAKASLGELFYWSRGGTQKGCWSLKVALGSWHTPRHPSAWPPLSSLQPVTTFSTESEVASAISGMAAVLVLKVPMKVLIGFRVRDGEGGGETFMGL